MSWAPPASVYLRHDDAARARRSEMGLANVPACPCAEPGICWKGESRA